MNNHEDWHDMKLTGEVQRFIETTRRTHLDERRAMIRFAPILCTCKPWYNWRDPEPAQLDCVVHTTIVFDQGEWL